MDSKYTANNMFCDIGKDGVIYLSNFGWNKPSLAEYIYENQYITHKDLYLDTDMLQDDEFMSYIINNVKTEMITIRCFELESIILDDKANKDMMKKINAFEKKGVAVTFSEVGEVYTADEVRNTLKQLDDVCDKINSMKGMDGNELSESEKFLYAYAYVRKRLKYQQESKDDSKISSRTLMAALNHKQVVCVGYAALLKTLCLKLGIDAVAIGTTLESLSEQNNHEICAVNIKDDKYNINGTYFSDPTNLKLKEALIPYKDLKKFLMMNTETKFTDITLEVEDFNKYIESVARAKDKDELSKLDKNITQKVVEYKIKEILSEFKDFKRGYSVDSRFGEGVYDIFEKYSKYKTSMTTFITSLMLKIDLQKYFANFENVKEIIKELDEYEFEMCSKLVAVDQVKRVNLNKIIENTSMQEIDKIKEIAKKHRNLYTLKKEGKIDF